MKTWIAEDLDRLAIKTVVRNPTGFLQTTTLDDIHAKDLDEKIFQPPADYALYPRSIVSFERIP